MQFEIVVEDKRREDRGKEAAYSTTGSNHEVKGSQAFRVGSESIQLTMANHATNKHAKGIDDELLIDRSIGSFEQCPGNRRQPRQQTHRIRQAGIPARAVETNDE